MHQSNETGQALLSAAPAALPIPRRERRGEGAGRNGYASNRLPAQAPRLPTFASHVVVVHHPAEGYTWPSIRWNNIWLPLVLAIAGWGVLSLDLPLARWCLAGNCPDPLDKWLSLCEVFAHGLGVAAILATITVLDTPRRILLPRLITASLGAGLAANACKLVIARVRPHSFSFAGGVGETFYEWFPWAGGGSGLQGFPSAHMATAAGLAVALTWLYPRGRWLFVLLAVSAGGQRVVSGDHFVSDVVWGAALGCFCAIGLFDGGLLAPLFDRLERRGKTAQ